MDEKIKKAKGKILLSPHNDDSELFACYTLLREKPLVIVVTDSYVEWNRGDGVTAKERIEETKKACEILGVDVEFLHLRDDEITEAMLCEALQDIYGVDTCYAPANEDGGNPIHNLVARVAPCYFDTVHYTTYAGASTKTKGSEIITPTQEEKDLKEKALLCYESQIKIPSTRAFFANPEVLEWESYE